jgi:hypothetical protein
MSYLQPINYEAYSRRNDGGLPEELRIRQNIISNAVEALLRSTPEPVAVSQKPAEETLATVTNIATKQIIDHTPDTTEMAETLADAPVTDVLTQVALARARVEEIWEGESGIQLNAAPTPLDPNYLNNLQAA